MKKQLVPFCYHEGIGEMLYIERRVWPHPIKTIIKHYRRIALFCGIVFREFDEGVRIYPKTAWEVATNICVK